MDKVESSGPFISVICYVDLRAYGRPEDASYRPTCSPNEAFRSERERATSGMRITMVSGCELGIVADRLLSLVGDDDRGALD